jgi:hypothetical protein
MNPEVKPVDNTQDLRPEVEEVKVEVSSEEPATITTYSASTQSNEQWRQVGERVSAFLAELPDYVGDFFNQYKRPITTIGLVFLAIISVKLTLAILDSLDDIPLLSPSLKLIGLGYSAWFVYRYLLRASNRSELARDFNALKEQILGQNSTQI